METIRNYLETMFARLPITLEVQKAKNELWQMMEDKYTELIKDGKTENEAVGIVIFEFGNLDELAEELGISILCCRRIRNRQGICGMSRSQRPRSICMTRHTLPVRWHSAYCCALLAAADICWIAVGACAAGSMPCALCFCRLRQQWHCLCIQVLSWENGNF